MSTTWIESDLSQGAARLEAGEQGCRQARLRIERELMGSPDGGKIKSLVLCKQARHATLLTLIQGRTAYR
jgi:hypothetical protein